MAVAQSQMAAGWIDELLRGRSALPYRELVDWDKSTVLRDSLLNRAKDFVAREMERLTSTPQFDLSVNDATIGTALETALLNSFTFTIGDLQDAANKSFGDTATSWSEDPLDLRSLEADAVTLARQVFSRADGLGFSGDVLETNVVATVLNMSEVKVLADVVKLEESLGTLEMNVEGLALVLARFQALRNDYVVTRKMIVGGNISELSAEMVEPEPAPAQVFAPAPSRSVPEENPFGDLSGFPQPHAPQVKRDTVPKAPAPQAPLPSMPPPRQPEPTARPQIAYTPMAPKPTAPIPSPTATAAPVVPAPVSATPTAAPAAAPETSGLTFKTGEVFDIKESWKETFLDADNRKALMAALRTRNDAEYDNWINKVAQQTSWKTARIHIDNYLYIFGIDRTAPVWLKMMKTSSLFFPDA